MTKKDFAYLRPGDKVVVGGNLKTQGAKGVVISVPSPDKRSSTGALVDFNGVQRKYHHKNLLKVPTATVTAPRTYMFNETRDI